MEQGHDVVGAYMKNWVNDEGIPGECPWEQDIQDALAVAKTTGIEFRVIDLVNEYRARIVNYLIEGYRAGYTPNPDVLCNREMKFGVFLDYALEQGFDYVATGHYARRMDTPQGAFILRGRDPNKDQSYFLSLMRPDQIARAVFPLGDLLKPEVRVLAEKYGLPTARKKDSQGICFIGQVKMSDFLRHYLPDKPGNGMHINLSAAYTLLSGRAGEDVLPRLIAGVLYRAAEMTPVLNPSEASYRRFGSCKAPRYISWSAQNRSQLIRRRRSARTAGRSFVPPTRTATPTLPTPCSSGRGWKASGWDCPCPTPLTATCTPRPRS